jgi:hypothetical protein
VYGTVSSAQETVPHTQRLMIGARYGVEAATSARMATIPTTGVQMNHNPAEATRRERLPQINGESKQRAALEALQQI